MNQGYFSQPTISKNHIAFISDDDLWSVERTGENTHLVAPLTARRLTSNRGFITQPCFSPDGQILAVLSSDNSAESDLYVLPSQGGEMTRLTWLGVNRVVGWKDAETIYFTSGIEAYPRRESHVYEINIKTKDFKKINLGPATYYHRSAGFQILARNSSDSARWKRYQGGTAGVLWVQQGKTPFKRILKNIKTNITKPEVIGHELFFISDHEGIGNVYSCDLNGLNLKRHTNHLEFYCRNLKSYEKTLVYQAGAEIYTYDLATKKESKLQISCATTAMQTVVRYESATRYLNEAIINPDLSQVTILTRGQIYQMAPFSGPVKSLGQQDNTRFSQVSYNFDGSKQIASVDAGEASDLLLVIDIKTEEKSVLLPQKNWGKVHEIKSSPKKDLFIIVNNRQEVYLVDLKNKSAKLIETGKQGRPHQFDWSPDGRYVAYVSPLSWYEKKIKVYDTKNNKLHDLFKNINSDYSPSFDPDGQYLYFLSVREYAPSYYETHFDLGFVFATRPYVVALTDKALNPFDKPFDNMTLTKATSEDKKSKNKKAEEVEIVFEGIDSHILPFKMPLGGYQELKAIKGGILFTKSNVEPITNHDHFAPSEGFVLYSYKFEDAQQEQIQKNVSFFNFNAAKSHVLYFADSKLRLIDAKAKVTAETKVGKKDGYLDTARLKLKIEPLLEWKQMYHEAWTLQKEHFWREDMSKIDWNLVYKRYMSLLGKVKTRAEFSDLVWEMQGELGTSHCYEMMGDYNRHGTGVSLGRLGAYFSFNMKSKSYIVDRLLAGDSWIAGADSPLQAMGVNLKVGDQIFAIDGVAFNNASDLYRLLENKSEIQIEIKVQKNNKFQNLIVKPNRSLAGTWYRDWVEANKKYVHEKSNGKIGYVHVPDMGSAGFAEFYRNYNIEHQYDGLIVDVRYNGGGHVSQHLLKILAQKLLGFDETRYQGLMPYPMYATGSMVALCNEYSGSDGDIFPHSFKLMKLGKLIGKRTWGGVIGINGQYSLRDRTYVTQPEYSYWFKDNEWHVENHGVDPDIEVDITPEDYQAGRDPQLDRGLKEVLLDLKKNPRVKFKPSYYPDLSLPKKLKKIT